MKHKRLTLPLLALALCLLLSACAVSLPAPSAATPAPTETPAETEAPSEPEAPAAAEPDEPEAEAGLAEDAFAFISTDRDGNFWDENCFTEATLTMINFWEPWCPPCVGEMPDLERLYQDYRERGFQILGVYSTEENAATVIEETGVSYPILHYVPEFDVFQTGYVPTTVFVNRWGEIVGQTQIGGRNYAAWAEIVEGLL